MRTRLGAAATAAALVLAVSASVTGMGPIVGLPALLAGVILGWRLVSGFWATILAGVAGGVLAGLAVLGPGLRLAMRVVAILDPVRAPEFTWEGTLMIIVFVGGLSGVMFGVVTALLLRVTTRSVSATVTVVGIMVMLLAPEELRNEVVELGGGPWVNLPMFAGVGIVFSLVLTHLIIRFNNHRVHAIEEKEMQA